MPRIREIIIAFVTSSIFISCHTKLHPVTTSTETEPEKILFLAYEVTRDSVSGRIVTKSLYQKTAAGLVKPGSIGNASGDPGNWQITVTDKKDIPVETLVIENPLYRKLEYVGADGKLGIKAVWLSRAEVAVRLNYKKSMSKVVVQEIGPGKSYHIIFNHSLLLIDK